MPSFSSILSRLRNRTRLRAKPEQRNATHFPLPLDIILVVADKLPLAALLSLALTCRDLYGRLFPTTLRLRDLVIEERSAFLQLLERDLPDLFYCYSCMKLHRWRRRWAVSANNAQFAAWQEEVGCIANSCFSLRDAAYKLPYPLARLVVARARCGSSYGLEARALDADFHTYYERLGVEVRQSWRAAVIHHVGGDGDGSDLFLRTVYDIRQRDGDVRKLRAHIDAHQFLVCWHLRTHHRDDAGRYFNNWQQRETRVPEMAACYGSPGAVANAGFSMTTNAIKVRSCQFCWTDVEVHITREKKKLHQHHKALRNLISKKDKNKKMEKQEEGNKEKEKGEMVEEGGLVIRLVVYRRLGACRRWSDNQWRMSAGVWGISWEEEPSGDETRLPVRDIWLRDEDAVAAERRRRRQWWRLLPTSSLDM